MQHQDPTSQYANPQKKESSNTQETSHLAVLLQRVREDETIFNYVVKEHLVNLAEFILSWPGKYSKFEYDEAIKILAKYHLAHLATRRHGWKAVQKELNATWRVRCARCGLPITSKASLATGYGIVCRRKLGVQAHKPSEALEPEEL